MTTKHGYSNYQSFCQNCVWQTHPEMLTTYSIKDAKCDRCGRFSDLALVHQHKAVDLGQVYEICECGAVRRRDVPGRPVDTWHVCDRCRLPGFRPARAQADG